MKNEILDVRTLITILLVVISLLGNRWSELNRPGSDAQNLNFIQSTNENGLNCITGECNLSLGEGV